MKRRKYFRILYWIFYAISYFCFRSEAVLIFISIVILRERSEESESCLQILRDAQNDKANGFQSIIETDSK